MREPNIYEEAAQAKPEPRDEQPVAGATQPEKAAPSAGAPAEVAPATEVDNVPVPGHEAAAVPPPGDILALESDEAPAPAPEPVVRAGADGREQAGITRGPGMPEETADAIREQQRLAHDSRQEQQEARETGRTEFTARGIALAQQYIEDAVTPALSGQFLKERIAEKRQVRGGAYPLTEGSSETGRPAELPDARLQAVRNSLVSLNEGTRGTTPPVRIAEAQRLMNEELRQQEEYKIGRVMLLDAEKQAKQQLQIALKEAGPTLFGKEGRLVRRMKDLRACLRNLGNPDKMRKAVADLKTLRDHDLAKDPITVDAKIAQFEGRLRAHENIDGFLAQKDLDPYLRFAIESRLKGQPVDYGDLSNPANALYQKVYEGTVDLLLGSARTTGEVPSPAAAAPGAIPAPERADGQGSQGAEADEESSIDDPVNQLRLIAKRKDETRASQEGHRQAIREGNEDAAESARYLIEIVGRSPNHDEVIRMAQQLVTDLLDDMKTMTPEELENTKNWLANFTGTLMVSENARDFKVDLMTEAILQVSRILSASGR